MNNLKVFENENFGSIRVIEENGEPWFVATDICEVLELSNATISLNRLDDDERSKLNLGRQGEANVVNEYGLYSLILGSRKPEAKQFKRWITHEVIPAIRKHGAYMTDQALYRAKKLTAIKIGKMYRITPQDLAEFEAARKTK